MAIILLTVFFAAGVLVYMNIPIKGNVPETIFDKAAAYDDADAPFLIKRHGQDFKILQFADIHLIVGAPGLDGKTFDLIKSAVKTARPDLIVFSGDQCFTAFNTAMYRRLTKVMGGIGVPWAFIYGNHDQTGPGDKAKLSNIAAGDANCLFRPGPSNIHGMGNYVINIKNPGGDNIFSVFMLDGNAGRDYRKDENVTDGTKGYDYIYPDQIEWYEWAVNGIAEKAGKTVPSVLFTHIPLPEYKTAYDAAENGAADAKLIYGRRTERECAPQYNTGLFDTMRRLGSTKAVFCGHDHINDYSVEYQGIRLTYGLSSGYGSYGNAHDKGATVITLKDDLSVGVEQLVVYPFKK